MWARWFNLLLGLWLLAAPLALGYTATPAWYNDMLVGAGVTAVALLTMIPRLRLAGWLNLAFGFWLLAFALSVPLGSAAMTNDITVGLLVALTAAFEAGEQHSASEVY